MTSTLPEPQEIPRTDPKLQALVHASSKSINVTLREWTQQMVDMSKWVPSLDGKWVTPKDMKQGRSKWRRSLVDIDRRLDLFTKFLNNATAAHKLKSKKLSTIEKMKGERPRIKVALDAKAVRRWRGYTKVVQGLIPDVLRLLNNEDWIPDYDAGEDTTQGLEELIEKLTAIRTSLGSIFHSLSKESSRIKLELSRVKNLPSPKPKHKEPTKPSKKKTSLPQSEWSMKFLQGLIEPKEDVEDEVEDALQLGFDPSKFKAKHKQGLLPAKEHWGIVTYTVALDAWIGPLAKRTLSGSPFEFEPEYVGGTTQESIGLKPVHEPGFWYLREGLVLGTPKKLSDWSDLMKWIAEISKIDPDYKKIFSHVIPYTIPVFKKMHYYWLLIPRKIDQFQIYDWDLA